MKIWEVFFSAGYHGRQDSELVTATDDDEAVEVFNHYFPKKRKYIFHVSEFEHKSWMKPMDQLKVFENPFSKVVKA